MTRVFAEPELNWLERYGVRVLTRASDTWPAPTDPIDVLTSDEQRALRGIHARAVLNAGVAGCLSAAASSLSGFLAPIEVDPVRHWTFVAGVTVVATGFEFAFLYWDGLRAVRDMAKAAGLRVHAGTALDATVSVALARAALELPSPPHNWLGVDPHRDVAKWQLLVFSLIYKGKVALTNLLVKASLRRILGPMATRTLLLWVSVPITGIWNAVVAHQLLWQARLRVMGPSAAVDLMRWITSAAPDGRVSELALRAIGGAIVSNREAHPNVLVLARLLTEEHPGAQYDLGDRAQFLQLLAEAAPEVQLQALRATIATAILDGRITNREWKWLTEVFASAGQPLPAESIRQLRKRFVLGQGVAAGLPEVQPVAVFS